MSLSRTRALLTFVAEVAKAVPVLGSSVEGILKAVETIVARAQVRTVSTFNGTLWR
jgi:hypothetical protein